MRPRNRHPTLTHPTVRQPTPSSSFLFLIVSLSLLSARSLSPSSSCHLSVLSPCPSSSPWQPYKPWSSASASSFTEAMYPDVSEGRNFASVCVLLLFISLCLSPSLALSISLYLSLALPPLYLSLSLYLLLTLVPSTLCSLPLTIFRSCKVPPVCALY